MKIVSMIIVLVLIFVVKSFAAKKDLTADLSFCLNSIYTAQKAYHEETKHYAIDLEEMGANIDNCPEGNFIIDSDDEAFSASLVDADGEMLGSINSEKEVTIF